MIDLSLPDREAAAAILHACVTTGFFYGKPVRQAFRPLLEVHKADMSSFAVANHGVKEEIVEEHWLQNKAFFSLPLKDKLIILADSNNRCVKPATNVACIHMVHWHAKHVLLLHLNGSLYDDQPQDP